MRLKKPVAACAAVSPRFTDDTGARCIRQRPQVQPQFNAYCGHCGLPSVASARRGVAAKIRIVRRDLFPLTLRVLLVLMVGASFVAPAIAREISAQEAVAQAQREGSGKLLSVQPLTVGKRKVYRIKLLTRDGRVRIVQVAAEQPASASGD